MPSIDVRIWTSHARQEPVNREWGPSIPPPKPFHHLTIFCHSPPLISTRCMYRDLTFSRYRHSASIHPSAGASQTLLGNKTLSCRECPEHFTHAISLSSPHCNPTAQHSTAPRSILRNNQFTLTSHGPLFLSILSSSSSSVCHHAALKLSCASTSFVRTSQKRQSTSRHSDIQQPRSTHSP